MHIHCLNLQTLSCVLCSASWAWVAAAKSCAVDGMATVLTPKDLMPDNRSGTKMGSEVCAGGRGPCHNRQQPEPSSRHLLHADVVHLADAEMGAIHQHHNVACIRSAIEKVLAGMLSKGSQIEKGVGQAAPRHAGGC